MLARLSDPVEVWGAFRAFWGQVWYATVATLGLAPLGALTLARHRDRRLAGLVLGTCLVMLAASCLQMSDGTRHTTRHPPVRRTPSRRLGLGARSRLLAAQRAQTVDLGRHPLVVWAAGWTSCSGLVTRTTRSASRPMAKTWNAANSTSRVLAANRKSLSTQS